MEGTAAGGDYLGAEGELRIAEIARDQRQILDVFHDGDLAVVVKFSVFLKDYAFDLRVIVAFFNLVKKLSEDFFAFAATHIGDVCFGDDFFIHESGVVSADDGLELGVIFLNINQQVSHDGIGGCHAGNA